MSGIIAVFNGADNFLLHFVNSLFYFALLFILVGGFMFVLGQGFFNITRYAFRRLFKSANKKAEDLIEEEKSEADQRDIIYRTYSFNLTYPILISGLILAFISTILSFLIS
ncbi:DUF3899 domain-containing protein [Bacillus sp. 165]|nr:DUF3899 domain-containing protein [Bacillus sp. 165]